MGGFCQSKTAVQNRSKNMSKRIIFCADGTWDDPESATNVYGLFKAIPISSSQIAYYDDGVGSDGTPLEKLTAGAFGDGLFQKIKDGYTKIAHVYEEGDEIFLFGFSRGAYTARSLAGMIAVCGLPTGDFDDDLVNDAFQAYRNKDQRAAFEAKYALFNAKIKMVGVWDTVGALGIPAIFGGIEVDYAFLDTTLHPDVLNAYQALAIDERRQEFPPTLWQQPAPAVPGQVLEQVWFAGVHCDVGGGYPETSLSDITLSWMLGKAVALGLQLDAGFVSEYGSPDGLDALDTIHESWSLLWLAPRTRTLPNDAALGNSVGIRCQYDTTYQPVNVKRDDGTLVDSYQIVPVVKPAPA
jgi:uncharacterized protein (DUF2235 family)